MEFQSAFERNLETIPVGELGIIALKSCEALGEKINAHIVQWRREREQCPVLVPERPRASYTTLSGEMTFIFW